MIGLWIAKARKICCKTGFGIETAGNVYALDSATTDLWLSVFLRAEFRKHKGGIKFHTPYDVKTSIPGFPRVTTAGVHDVNIPDIIPYEAGSFYKGYIDFERHYKLRVRGSFCSGAKDNTRFKRMLSRSADKTTGVRYERIGKPETFSPAKACPDKLRRVRHYIANNNRTFIFLTNNTGLKAEEIAMLCRKRREAELFSNGLNSICQSNPFWGGQPWMLSKSKSAVRSLLIVWLPSSVTNWKWTAQSANWKSTKWNFTDPRHFFAR